MRLLDIKRNIILDKVELNLSFSELEDLYFRMYDMTFNPGYDDTQVINDVILEEKQDNQIVKNSVEISKYSSNNLNNFNEEIKRLIIKDTI